MVDRNRTVLGTVLGVMMLWGFCDAIGVAQEKGKKQEPQKGNAKAVPSTPGKKAVPATTRPEGAKKKDDARKAGDTKKAGDELSKRKPEGETNDTAPKKTDDEKDARDRERERDGERLSLGSDAHGDGKGAHSIDGETKKHVERLAKLDRLKEIALEQQNQKLLENVEKLTAKENDRHTRALMEIEKPGDAPNLGKKAPEKKDGDKKSTPAANPKQKKSDGDAHAKEKKSDASKRSKDHPTTSPKDKRPNPKKD